MTVTVVTARETAEVFYTANNWHIDEDARLHIRNAEGQHVGAFAHGHWAYVIEDEATKKPDAGPNLKAA